VLNNMLSRVHKFCEIGRCTCWTSAHSLRSCCRYRKWHDSRWIIRTCWAWDVWRVDMGKYRYDNIFSTYVIKKLIYFNFSVGIRFISLVLTSNLWVIIVFLRRTVLRKVLSDKRFLSAYKRTFNSSLNKMFSDQRFWNNVNITF